MDSIEKKVADAVLQTPKTVMVGENTYQVAPPTIATLMLVSKYISMLPKVEIVAEKNVLSEVLRTAKDCGFVGDIAAILILGARGLSETKKVVESRYFGLIKQEKEVVTDKKAMLVDEILNSVSPKYLEHLIGILLSQMEISHFFSLTTFLQEINLLKETKREVD